MRRKLLSILALLCLTVTSAWAGYGWYDGSMTIGGKTTDPTAWSTDSSNPTDLGCVSDMTISSIAFKVWSDANDRVGANMYFRILDGSSQVGQDQDFWLGASTRITGDHDFSISWTDAEDLAVAVGLTLETGKTYYIDMWAKTYGDAGDEWYSGDLGSNYHAKLTIAHALVAHPAVAATCTTAGNSAYWSCSACGKYFSDENGENEISADSWEIPATGHTIVNNICSGCGKYGYCGTTSNESDVTWELTGTSPDYTLTISGTGAMKDDDPDSMPWYGYKDQIRTVVIKDGVTTICDGAFNYCSSLKSVSIPASVTYIGFGAFESCKKLATVDFADGSQLETIGWYAFFECRNLTAIDIPSGVTAIGVGAFVATDLTTITIPAGVTHIGDDAFSDCVGLASVTFEAGSQLESIGKKAFCGTALSSVTIPAKVTSIGEGAFSDCEHLTSIKVDENNTAFYSDDDDHVLFSMDGTTLHTYPAGLTATKYKIPDGVTTICGYAFFCCYDLEDIVIKPSVTSIGERAFEGTAWFGSQTPVDGDGVIYVNNIAIYYDNSSNELTIKDGTTKIAPCCFSGCDALTSVTIPASVTTIDNKAFADCRNLASVTFEDGSKLTAIGDNAFWLTALTTVTLNSNPKIGAEAFPSGAAVTMNLTANAAGGAKWMTFCSGYGNFKADENTQVFQAELNAGTLTLREINDKIVNVDEGVILKSTGNPVMTLTDEDSEDGYGYNSLYGVTDPDGRENDDNCLYVLNNGSQGVGFYKLAAGKTIGYGKACLWYDGSTTAPEFFSFDVANVTTGMSDVRSKMADVRGDFFDLQGRKVVNPTKGLYIVNGKKVIIK